uniref:Uncharacterized protein n=1 Tax=Utricularia reniformis TaxID=192314 RepID=A0A1Y0B3L9_9LAMI|nr:hypothetical protein AEK19_MT1806 [Utricularia reniformis]ART31977.1 hypothetical protein AEK19_MT1806 [Utricularia reniformis]
MTRNRNNPIARAQLFPPDAYWEARSRCLDEPPPSLLLFILYFRISIRLMCARTR